MLCGPDCMRKCSLEEGNLSVTPVGSAGGVEGLLLLLPMCNLRGAQQGPCSKVSFQLPLTEFKIL